MAWEALVKFGKTSSLVTSIGSHMTSSITRGATSSARAVGMLRGNRYEDRGIGSGGDDASDVLTSVRDRAGLVSHDFGRSRKREHTLAFSSFLELSAPRLAPNILDVKITL